jgi:putative transcriptional regulator
MPITNSVRERRKAAGLTQEELSRICGVSRQTIIAVERRLHEPTLSLALRLATALDTTVDELFALEITATTSS